MSIFTARLKFKVAQLIDSRNHDNYYSRLFEGLIVGLILLNVVAIVLESFEHLRTNYRGFFHFFELVSVIIFTIEYVLRIWIADLVYREKSYGKSLWKFVGSWDSIIDILAILPFYLPLILDLRFMRILRMMRLLRLLKLKRYSKAITIIGDVVRESKAELNITLFMTSILLFIASTLMYYLENSVQPDAFPDIPSTLWWAVATLTTVGYGDVYPITAMGKLLSGIMALLGIGIVALPTGIISASFLDRLEQMKKEQGRVPEKTEVKRRGNDLPLCQCPHCQQDIDVESWLKKQGYELSEFNRKP